MTGSIFRLPIIATGRIWNLLLSCQSDFCKPQGIRKYLLSDSTGATAIEYALIAALLSLAGVAGLTTMGTSLDGIFTFIANTADNAMN
jgi:pilus assembly protein Flp/PilA